MEMNTSGSQNEKTQVNGGEKFGFGQKSEKEKASSCSLSAGEGVKPGESGEGSLTKQIESVTSKIPSATFLSLAVGSIGLSALLQVCGRKADAQFVGQWVPTILTLGLYNKLVKLEGSE